MGVAMTSSSVWRRSVLLAALMVFAGLIQADAQEARLDTLQEMYRYLGRCWRRPALPAGSRGMQITIRFSFKRSGEIFGQPVVTFESGDATDELRAIYRAAVTETLQRCSPLPISDGLGGAIAGRPFIWRFDDRRDSLPRT